MKKHPEHLTQTNWSKLDKYKSDKMNPSSVHVIKTKQTL